MRRVTKGAVILAGAMGWATMAVSVFSLGMTDGVAAADNNSSPLILAPAALAGRQNVAMENGREGQKARPDPRDLTLSVMIAQANQAQPRDVKSTRTIGVCRLIPNAENTNPTLENKIRPIANAKEYFYLYEHQKPVSGLTAVTILQQPKHGMLQALDLTSNVFIYLPEKGYLGKDSAILLVDIGGLKVQVKYYFEAIDTGTVGEGLEDSLCPEGKHFWKISSTLDANGNSTITSVEYQSPTTADILTTDTAVLASTLGSSVLTNLTGDTAGVTLTFADLPGAAVGQTFGSAITLDTTAAGYNWFIDTTPADNSEFLPTSNPNEWIAKAGSAASGKMDMLSVLLHEYGHALGTSFIGFLGLLRSSRYGGLEINPLAKATDVGRFAMNPTQQMMK